jgi:hypothetical protein
MEAGWLIESGIISKANYDYLCQSDRIDVVRRACRSNPALVAYESFPERFKAAIREKLGNRNPYDTVKTCLIEGYIEHDARISAFFDTYEISPGRNLPKESRQVYYSNAIVLEAVGKLFADKRAKRAGMGKSLKINWKELSEGIQEIDRSRYPHSLPECARRLRDRFNRYKAEGAVSLINKNFLNANAAKVNDEVKESVIIELLADPRNLDNSQVAGLYNAMAGQMEWKTITPSAVAVWRDRYDLQIYAGRRGSVAFSNTKAMQVKRKAPSYPLYYWTMDGWDVELLYQKTENGTTTYHHRPTVVIVLDACLKYPVGYAIGTHETPELIQQALRNAAGHTQELFGKMYRTAQLQSDRYAIKKLTPCYGGMAEKVTPARAKNAKAKIIEPYFGSINKRYCQLLPNWSGFGITSDREKQPNVEFLNKYKAGFPDFAGVCRQVEMIIERERTCDGKRERFMELWAQAPEEHRAELSFESYLLLFGETTGYRNTLEGSGLKVAIHGVKRDYDCFDLTFRKHASVRWEVRYDPGDLSRVLAVNEDESLRYILEEKFVQPMALRERKEGDSGELKRVNDYNKRLREEVTGFRSRAEDVLRQAAVEIPELGDTLSRLLITDSAGQHKDNRNRERMLKTAEKINERYEEAAAVRESGDFKEKRLEYMKRKVNLSEYV